MDRVIVGLGNPDAKYAETRHNIGSTVVDGIARQYGVDNFNNKFDALYGKTTISGLEVALVKPMTYMNNSGIPTARFINFFKVDPSNVIVIHDDLDLTLGRIKLKKGGGHGGHNGLKSMDAHIGQNYYRLRFGISHPGDASKVHSHVLSNFTATEREMAEKAIQFILQNMEALLALGIDNINNLAGQFYKNQIMVE